jgi:osmotically-inducible protein OsmY
MRVLALAAAFGAALMFFFDPASGRRRRALVRDRTAGTARRRARAVARSGRAVGSEVYGVAKKATHLREEPKDLDDNTLRAKVETELFRDQDVPKGQINVNAQNGVIQLRGEVEDPEMIRELVEKARKVQGVQDVENLLHLPKRPAPMHQ